MNISNVNYQSNQTYAEDEILFKGYSYKNGKAEETVFYKKDSVEISLESFVVSEDSPTYENIRNQMTSITSKSAVGSTNRLFYETYEIMYDYYDGKLTEEDVKNHFKEYLYHAVGEPKENDPFQKQMVTAGLGELYELFTRGNTRNAVNQNQLEGKQVLRENGITGCNQFYYNAKWYWKCEEMQDLFKETANELAEEYGAEQVDFETVEENTKYTLDGGLSFNGVWNWNCWQTNLPSPLGDDNYLDEDMVPPKDFIYCTGNPYTTNTNGESIEESVKELSGNDLLNYLFLYLNKGYDKLTTDSLFLNKDNWKNNNADESSYTKAADILKNFHIQYFSLDRFEFLLMGK